MWGALVDSQGFFEVEAILMKRTVEDQDQYFIQWKGTSGESEADFDWKLQRELNSSSMVDSYHEHTHPRYGSFATYIANPVFKQLDTPFLHLLDSSKLQLVLKWKNNNCWANSLVFTLVQLACQCQHQ